MLNTLTVLCSIRYNDISESALIMFSSYTADKTRLYITEITKCPSARFLLIILIASLKALSASPPREDFHFAL